ncbi:Gfo/Idh/MocA family protein [Soonwooa purpurea]
MNILIVGLGSIAKKHIAAIRKLDEQAKLYALRNQNPSSQEEDIENVYNVEDIKSKNIEYIIISNPTFQHYKSIKELAQFNLPMFIEKPLFSEVSKDTDDLVEAIEQQDVLTYVACNLRFLDALSFVKKQLEGKWINEVNVYCGSYLPDWRPNVDFRTIYSANKDMGGGVHIDLIHELDYVYWIFGTPNDTQSYFSNKSSLNISAIDYANYLWHYDQFSASIILNYYRKDSKRTLEVVTEEGTYQVDILNNTVHLDNQLIFESKQRIIDTYENQIRFFTNNVMGNKEKFNTIAEANTILKLCMQD